MVPGIPPSGVILNPTGLFLQCFERLQAATLAGDTTAISTALADLTAPLQRYGRTDLAKRVEPVAEALRSGHLLASHWDTSRLSGELEEMQVALEEGRPLDEALRLQVAHEQLGQVTGNLGAPVSITARRPPRSVIGPPPIIHWSQFGSPDHPAPRPPSEGVQTAGQKLGYFMLYVAGMAGHGGSESAPEGFFDISAQTRRRLRDGLFAPTALRNFPTDDARRLIDRSARIEPLWGELMTELIVGAFFESQGWSLGLPRREALWHVKLLYRLRQYVARQLLFPAGARQVFDDKPLVAVVQKRASLEEVKWHPGQTRREVWEPWLEAMSGIDPEVLCLREGPKRSAARQEVLRRERLELGQGILKEMGRRAAGPQASEGRRLQWLFIYWVAHFHYGALPARGLPYQIDLLRRFAMARELAEMDPAFVQGLLRLMKDFYSEEDHRPVLIESGLAREMR